MAVDAPQVQERRTMRMTSGRKWILATSALLLLSIELVDLWWFSSTYQPIQQNRKTTKTSIPEAVVALDHTMDPEHQQQPARKSSFWDDDDNNNKRFLGVEPRAYPRWNATSLPLPCLEWPRTGYQEKGRRGRYQPPLQRGFLFLKPKKVGGSTAVGIHLRYTHRLAARLGIGGRSSDLPSKSVGLENHRAYNCQGRWDHGQALKVHAHRDKSQSFLWTLVRHPTKRAVSDFFFFRVSRESVRPTYRNFAKDLRSRKEFMQDYYPKYLATNATLIQALLQNRTSVEAARDVLFQIGWRDYDFIGVTERMDETAVALMMLLNGTIADILFLNAKNQGSYDALCYKVQPTNLTTDMKSFLSSPTWQAQIQWDEMIFKWANASLDRTIHALNATTFASNLQTFRDAQDVVRQECGSLDVFPCTKTGEKNYRNSDCLWHDSGCAFTCINQVVQKLGLDPHPIRPEEYLVDPNDDDKEEEKEQH